MEQKHELETRDWGIIGIGNYKGVLIQKIIGGYLFMGVKCKTPEDVDRLLEQARTHLKNSITIRNNGDMECSNNL